MAKKKGTDYRALARQIARQVGVPESLFLGLVQQESGFNPGARSGAGAVGLTQLMPGTAEGLGVDPTDPRQNLLGGARYLRSQLQRFGNDPRLALSAYNSGPGGAEAQGRVEQFPETQAYVQNVMALEQQYRGAGGSPMTAGPPAAGAQRGPGMQSIWDRLGQGVEGMVPSLAGDEPSMMGGASPEAPEGGTPGMETLLGLIGRAGPLSGKQASSLGDILQMKAEQEAGQQQGSPLLDATAATASPFSAVNMAETGAPASEAGFNAEFDTRLNALIQAIAKRGGDLGIGSGARSDEEQTVLWNQALKKYGSEAAARKWVAPPGKSNHGTHAGLAKGLGDGAIAADLRGDLQLAHELAPQFGLTFPLSNEAWHIELAGARGK